MFITTIRQTSLWIKTPDPQRFVKVQIPIEIWNDGGCTDLLCYDKSLCDTRLSNLGNFSQLHSPLALIHRGAEHEVLSRHQKNHFPGHSEFEGNYSNNQITARTLKNLKIFCPLKIILPILRFFFFDNLIQVLHVSLYEFMPRTKKMLGQQLSRTKKAKIL